MNQIEREREGEMTYVESGLLTKIVDALVSLSTEKVCSEGTNPIRELEDRLIIKSRNFFRQ
jgi:hypothetical protein